MSAIRKLRWPAKSRKLALVSLESRDLPAAELTATLSHGALIVRGTDTDDVITVREANGLITVDGIAIRIGRIVRDSLAADKVRNLTVFGQSGNDAITIDDNLAGTLQPFRVVKIFGGLGNDTVLGSKGVDRIRGNAGNDEIWGRGGLDLILGDQGDDRVFADAGARKLSGGWGNDQIKVVTSFQSPVGVRITAGPGNDIIIGSEGSDFIHGNAGNDQIWARGGNDRINGGAGDDQIFGEDGDDYLSGYSGNDLVRGGDGRDHVNGGTGSNLVLRDSDDTVVGGTLRRNRVDFAPFVGDDAYTTNEDIALEIPATSGVLSNDHDADGDPLTLELLTEPEHGMLTLNADGSFSYAPELDYSGLDSFIYQLDDGVAVSEPATVSITVDRMAAKLSGSILTITGTDNADTYTIEQVDGQISLDGLHILDLTSALPAVIPSVAASSLTEIHINGLRGNDIVRLDSGAVAGQQEILVPTVIDGGDGDDVIYGASGGDTVQGGAGNDEIHGGEGNDVVQGGADSDLMTGDQGSDQLFGEVGDDLLLGGIGNDVLFGAEGDDYLNGWDLGQEYATDHDELDGGPGANVYASIDSGPADGQEHDDGSDFLQLASGGPDHIGFVPIYSGSGWTDEAKIAFQFVCDIWSDLLIASYRSETIHVSADFSDLGSPIYVTDELAHARPADAFGQNPSVGSPLANHRAGYDLDPNAPEITVTMNSHSDSGWYIALDGNPSTFVDSQGNPQDQIDFVTVLLHEIGHGLNFSSRFLENGSILDFYEELPLYHRWKELFGMPAPSYSPYDEWLETGAGVRLKSMTDAQREAALISNDLWWGGTNAINANNGTRPQMYAPPTWDEGSSVSHLDEFTLPNELMSPAISGVDHTPSPMELGILRDMGWDTLNIGKQGATGSGTAIVDIIPSTSTTPNTKLSSDGNIRLTLQSDGNLVLYYEPRSILLWQSHTAGTAAKKLVLESNGMLSLQTAWGRPVRRFSGADHPGARLVVQNDGNLVLYAADDSVVTQTYTGWVGDVPLDAGNNLVFGETMTPGSDVYSSNGRFRLRFQSDGNLVLYFTPTGATLWTSGTAGRNGTRLIMQNGGNLVMYDASDDDVWSTDSDGHPGACLKVQDDGNVVLYGLDGSVLFQTYTDWASEVPPDAGDNLIFEETITAGTDLFSNNGKFQLRFQTDGNLVLYFVPTGAILWSSDTDGLGGTTLTMQKDGNLVMRNSSGAAVWSSNTQGHPGAYLKVQNDGNLVIYPLSGSVLFETHTEWASEVPPNAGNNLIFGESITTGTDIYSNNGRFRLRFQTDGNLVLYFAETGVTLWSSGTAGWGGATLIMKTDGNLVMRNSSGSVVWSTNTQGHPGAYLKVQDDGNVVIYPLSGSVLFETNTAWASQVPPNAGNNLIMGEVLSPGSEVYSSDGRLLLKFQSDRNFVLYYLPTGQVLWATNTQGQSGATVTMEKNGNLVMRRSSGSIVWSTGTSGYTGAYLVVQNDGNVVIYSLNGTVLWRTNTRIP